MALQHLTDEQVATWSREKDRWWLDERMAAATCRNSPCVRGCTGILVGGILSPTNLYVGAKTGWTLGVGITSVILAFATFKLLSAMDWARTT